MDQMGEKGRKTRAEILRAYNDLVYEEGVKNITIRKIAGKAGVRVGNLNYYFKKKSDMGYALAKDLYAKTGIILRECIKSEISEMDKALLDLFITILLFHRIKPLQNLALDCAADPSIIENSVKALSNLFLKMFSGEEIRIDEDTVNLAIKSALMAFFFACKVHREKNIFFTTKKYMLMTCGVLFSIIGLPARPYINSVMKYINRLDENYIIEQIYTLQDYDYELK